MATNESAVAVIEQGADAGVVSWNLDNFPEGQFNRVLQTQTLDIPTDLLRPVVQVVKLNPDDKAGDVYSSKDMPAGHAAPTKVGLRKLATAAGISFLDERRTDDGTNPDVIEVTCLAEMLLPTGQRITATGIKRIDLNAMVWNSPEHRGKFKSFFLEHVASRAQNRAIRALLSIRGSYPKAVYDKPFAVVSYAPNMNHPAIRERFLAGLEGTAAQLYGAKAAPKQVGPGPAVIEAPQALEEDPAPAPTELPGEKIAKAQPTSVEEPAWLRDEPPAGLAANVDFATSVRHSAAAVEDPELLASSSEIGALRTIFTGWQGQGVIAGGILALWPGQNVEALASGQAKAIATAYDSMGREAFEAAWRAMLEKAAAA